MSSIVVATKGGFDSDGLAIIYLHLFADSHQGPLYKGTVKARSGLRGCQTFRKRADQVPGHYEPCPEGVYPLGEVEWHDTPGDYDSLWPAVSSPVWIEIDSQRATGIHLDHQPGTPGTSGCIGLLLDQLKALMNFINGYGSPKTLYTNWGLGSVHPPVTIPEHFKML